MANHFERNWRAQSRSYFWAAFIVASLLVVAGALFLHQKNETANRLEAEAKAERRRVEIRRAQEKEERERSLEVAHERYMKIQDTIDSRGQAKPKPHLQDSPPDRPMARTLAE